MSEPAGNKTEEATPERLRKARREGQLPQSQEVGSAMMIAALLVMLALAGPGLLSFLIGQIQLAAGGEYPGEMDQPAMQALLLGAGTATFLALAPFLAGGAVVSVFASVVASGLAYCPKAVKIKWSNISPIKGAKNMVSWQSMMKLAASIAKLLVIGLVSWVYLKDKLPTIMVLVHVAPGGLTVATGRLVFGLLVRIALALAGIAILDLLFQRWNWKRKLRMTKQEVKEEYRLFELAPEVKGRIRQLQMQAARKRMLTDVASADVVVTNPTHFAVALKYDGLNMSAPVVVAKGADLLARRIRELAAEHDVPIIERPPLARALYAAAQVGQAIPENLFVAVAEVLAMVYRLRQRHRAR